MGLYNQYNQSVKDQGWELRFGKTFGEGASMLVMITPDNVDLIPDDTVPGVQFRETYQTLPETSAILDTLATDAEPQYTPIESGE